MSHGGHVCPRLRPFRGPRLPASPGAGRLTDEPEREFAALWKCRPDTLKEYAPLAPKVDWLDELEGAG